MTIPIEYSMIEKGVKIFNSAVSKVTTFTMQWLGDLKANLEMIDLSSQQNEPLCAFLLKRTPYTEEVAYGVFRAQFKPAHYFKGKCVKWEFIEIETSKIRGSMGTKHAERFEAVEGREANKIDGEGYAWIRLNLPRVAFNRGKIKASCLNEALDVEAFAECDVEVPAVVVLDPGHGGKWAKDMPKDSSWNNAWVHAEVSDKVAGDTVPGNEKVFHWELKKNLIPEKMLTLDLVQRIRDALEKEKDAQKLPLTIHLTRDSDINLPGVERANWARDHAADLFLSIHFNSSTGQRRGSVVLVRKKSDGNLNVAGDEAFAERILAAAHNVLSGYDEGIGKRNPINYEDADVAVLNDINLGNVLDKEAICPAPVRACLLEVLFIDNKQDAALWVLGTETVTMEEVRNNTALAVAGAIVESLYDGGK